MQSGKTFLLSLILLLWLIQPASAIETTPDSVVKAQAALQQANQKRQPPSKALENYIKKIKNSPVRIEDYKMPEGGIIPPRFEDKNLLNDKDTFSRHFLINYRVDIADIDTNFMDNANRINELREFLRDIRENPMIFIDSVRFTGTASPDGYIEYNRWLSENRLDHFKELTAEEIYIPDSIIFLNDSYITWQNFREGVEASDIPYKEEVLSVIDLPADTVKWNWGLHTDSRLLTLRNMHNGKVWNYLKPILYYLRYADAEFVVKKKKLPLPEFIPFNPLAEISQRSYLPPLPPYEIWKRRLYIKTNFVKWALLISNVSVEVDLIRHWTLDLSVFYSKWDYFRPEIRFRFAGFMPELRYWFNSEENDGWFIGGHFGYSYYNLGFNGAHRYQDLYGKTPTKGGGLSFGWRKQFGYKNRWRLEFSAGAGVYPLHYSVFENTHDYHNGQWLEERKKTYFGLDQLSVSIGYAIDLFSKKVRQKQWWQ